MKGRRFLGAIVIGVCIAGLSVSAQTWYELYDDAIRDVNAGRWEQAEARLQRARKSGPRSGDRVLRYGNLYDHFFPEFYLGIVYLETNRPKEAVEQFRLARQANVEKARNADFRRVAELEKRAESRILIAEVKPPVFPPPDPPGKPLPPTPTPGTAKPGTPTPTSVPVKPVDPLEGIRQRFTGDLNNARGQLAQRNFARADELARSARGLAEQNNLSSQRDEADTLISQINGAAARDLAEAIQRRDSASGRRLYDSLVATLPRAAEPFRARLEQLERELATADAERQALSLQRNAMVAFFNGNYAQTLNLLGAAEKLTPLTPRGHLYRACGLAATALAQPAADTRRMKQLTEEALRSYRAAARDGSQFRQDLQYISPKIRQMLGIK